MVVNGSLHHQETRPPPGAEASSVRLFGVLPSWVQEKDLHRGNIPKLGEWMEKESQIRHDVRSCQNTTPQEARLKSRKYVWEHLYWAWRGMRKGVFHQPKWYDFINDSSFDDFEDA